MDTKKKPIQKYKLPSQRVFDIINQASDTGTPMGPIESSMLVSLAILDKLEEVSQILRSFIPRPSEEKKNDS